MTEQPWKMIGVCLSPRPSKVLSVAGQRLFPRVTLWKMWKIIRYSVCKPVTHDFAWLPNLEPSRNWFAKISMEILIARCWRHSDVKWELSNFRRNYVRLFIERQNQRSSWCARIRDIPAPSPRKLWGTLVIVWHSADIPLWSRFSFSTIQFSETKLI
jgi:hypothetical protein